MTGSPESLRTSPLITQTRAPCGHRPAVCLILTVNDVLLVLSGLVVSTAASELRGSGFKNPACGLNVWGLCVLPSPLWVLSERSSFVRNHSFNIYPDK